MLTGLSGGAYTRIYIAATCSSNIVVFPDGACIPAITESPWGVGRTRCNYDCCARASRDVGSELPAASSRAPQQIPGIRVPTTLLSRAAAAGLSRAVARGAPARYRAPRPPILARIAPAARHRALAGGHLAWVRAQSSCAAAAWWRPGVKATRRGTGACDARAVRRGCSGAFGATTALRLVVPGGALWPTGCRAM